MAHPSTGNVTPHKNRPHRQTPYARPGPGPQVGVEGDAAGGFREEGHRLAQRFQDHLAMIRDRTTNQVAETS